MLESLIVMIIRAVTESIKEQHLQTRDKELKIDIISGIAQ